MCVYNVYLNWLFFTRKNFQPLVCSFKFGYKGKDKAARGGTAEDKRPPDRTRYGWVS
jgi:hypothetical protein